MANRSTSWRVVLLVTLARTARSACEHGAALDAAYAQFRAPAAQRYELQPASSPPPRTRGHSLQRRGAATAPAFAPLRASFDVSLLADGADGARSCRTAGQYVARGTPKDQSIKCGYEGESHCWKLCTAGLVSSAAQRAAIKATLVPAARKYIEAALAVRRVKGALRLTGR